MFLSCTSGKKFSAKVSRKAGKNLPSSYHVSYLNGTVKDGPQKPYGAEAPPAEPQCLNSPSPAEPLNIHGWFLSCPWCPSGILTLPRKACACPGSLLKWDEEGGLFLLQRFESALAPSWMSTWEAGPEVQSYSARTLWLNLNEQRAPWSTSGCWFFRLVIGSGSTGNREQKCHFHSHLLHAKGLRHWRYQVWKWGVEMWRAAGFRGKENLLQLGFFSPSLFLRIQKFSLFSFLGIN